MPSGYDPLNKLTLFSIAHHPIYLVIEYTIVGNSVKCFEPDSGRADASTARVQRSGNTAPVYPAIDHIRRRYTDDRLSSIVENCRKTFAPFALAGLRSMLAMLL